MINVTVGAVEWVRTTIVDVAGQVTVLQPVVAPPFPGAADLTALSEDLCHYDSLFRECVGADLNALVNTLESIYQRFVTTDAGMSSALGGGDVLVPELGPGG